MNKEIERRLRNFVNRKAEKQSFCNMLDRDDRYILLISGESGVGKSLLFAWMIRECELRNRKKAEVIWSDFRPHNYLAIMQKICDDFGRELFQPFIDLINHFAARDSDARHHDVKISVEGSVQVGQGLQMSQSSARNVAGVVIEHLNLVGDMAVPEAERLIRLTDCFLESFAAALANEPLVVFFDAVEKMDESTRKWVWSELLKAVLD